MYDFKGKLRPIFPGGFFGHFEKTAKSVDEQMSEFAERAKIGEMSQAKAHEIFGENHAIEKSSRCELEMCHLSPQMNDPGG